MITSRRRFRCRRRNAILIVLAVLAAGCTHSDVPKQEELVWAINGAETGDGGLAREVVKKWNETPGRPTVRLEALPQSTDEQRQLLTVELNAQLDDIDILSLDVVWTGEFAENDWLVDLEGERGPIERASSPGPFTTATWRGKLWAAPFTTGAGFLYYRRDLLKDQPVPTTWDDLMRVGLELGGASDIAPFVGQGAQYEGMVVNYLEYLWSAGGELFDREGTHARFEEEPALAALGFMRKAREQGFYAQNFDRMKEGEAQDAFRSGNAVFMRNWPGVYADLIKPQSKVAGKFGIAPLPTIRGSGTVSALGGYNLGVSRFSKQQRWAKDFVKFASTSEPLQSGLALTHATPPTIAAVYAEDAARKDPVMSLLGRVLPAAKPRPPTPAWSTISDEIQQQIFPAYNGSNARDRDAVRAVREVLKQSLRERP